MNSELSCSLEVQEPGLGDITKTVMYLMGFLRDHGISDDVFLGQFELATAEAINNATEHGCSASEKKFFRVWLHLRAESVELRVMDPSDFGGWKGEASLPDDPFAEGGRGHFLMAQMTDEIRHEKEDGCHVLILRKSISQRWQYEPGLAETTISEMTDELVSSYELINTLVGLGEWLATAPDMYAFMDGALERLCQVTGAETAYVRFEDHGKLALLRQWGDTLTSPSSVLDVTDAGVEADVFRTGREITLPMDFVLPPNDPMRGMLVSGFVSPVLFKDQKRGVLVMGRTTPSQFFDAGKLKIARMVADYLGIIVTLGELQRRRGSEERALRDLEIAAQIQLSLMPNDFSSAQGFDIFGTCRPALQAGGDYFDVLVLPDQSVLCTLADVMGKGLSAALVAAMLRTNLHAIVAGNQSDPGRILAQVNRLMSRDLIKLEMFITMVCIWIPPGRDKILHASAGHLSNILQKAAGEILPIDGAGVPLGIFHDSSYTSQETPFGVGDRILLYTDGIIEATGADDTLFEVDRLKSSLGASRSLSSKATVDNLLNDVAAFAGKETPADDRTLILISRIL